MQSDAGTLLVEGGVITEEQLKQALTASLDGGQLVQHIVRLGFATDHFLAGCFSRQLDIPLLEDAQIENIPAFILRLVPPDIVQEHHVIPIMLHQGILFVAMDDPTSRTSLEEIAFLTGYSVSPVAAAQSLVRLAMEKYYGIPTEESTPEGPKTPPPPALFPPFNQDNAPPEPASGELAELFRDQLERHEIIHLTKLKVVAPQAPPTLFDGLAAESAAPIPEPPCAEMDRERADCDAERAPISAAEARVLIAQAVDRDEVARVLVQFAACLVERVILFQARQGLLVGWLGQGDAPLSVKGLMVPLAPASVFRTVSETGSDYFGSMPHATVNDTFLHAIGDLRPSQVLLIPILVQHKLIALLYGDCGGAKSFSRDLGDVHLTAELAAKAFEKLILEKKGNRSAKS